MNVMKMTSSALAVICLAAPAGLAACAQSKSKNEQEPVVIGAEGLKAAEAEARRKARGDTGRSPMPAGGYKFSREELGLVNPKPNALDSALAEPGTAELIRHFLKRPAGEKDLRDVWGRAEVEAEGGVRLIGWGFKSYEPTYDLKKIAVDVARLVAADRYTEVSAEVASELPRHWLETDDNAALDRALRSVRAGASVNGSHGEDAATGMPKQVLMVFLVELSGEAEARALLEVAGRRKPSDDAVLALAEGRLFCLLVARSVLAGAENEETNEGVRRFSGGLAEILRRHSKG